MWNNWFNNYWFIIWVTEYYTGTNYRPVKSVAAYLQQQDMAQMLFKVLAVSMEATAIPALIIVAGILFTNAIAGFMV